MRAESGSKIIAPDCCSTTARDVAAFYRLAWGREPEIEEMFAAHVAAAPTLASLRECLLAEYVRFYREVVSRLRLRTSAEAVTGDLTPRNSEMATIPRNVERRKFAEAVKDGAFKIQVAGTRKKDWARMDGNRFGRQIPIN